jgi:hypothetical protein
LFIVVISRVKRKLLFALRLCLLVLIFILLVIQIYGVFKTGAAPPADPVTAGPAGAAGYLDQMIEWLKEYYRENPR